MLVNGIPFKGNLHSVLWAININMQWSYQVSKISTSTAVVENTTLPGPIGEDNFKWPVFQLLPLVKSGRLASGRD